MATATMALQQGGKLFSMCMMDSQLPFMMADVTSLSYIVRKTRHFLLEHFQ